jgi:3-carboxy-cis,cis-muconate cycloisomerase
VSELAAVAEGCAALAETHRDTPMAARTLLQQAVPTTFGLKAAGWLVAVLDARDDLVAVLEGGLAAQLGGAAGNLAALGADALEVVRLYAFELGLAEPLLPWHTERQRVARLGAALDRAAGALAKIGLDVALLSQTEVAEVAESSPGGSSTMPQKRNPVGSTLARACARQVRSAALLLSSSLEQEHERAIGAWHAEWSALSSALAYTGGAAAAIHGVVDGLAVDASRMRANLEQGGGLALSEQAVFALAPAVGRQAATALVARAVARSRASGRTLADELDHDPALPIERQTLARALDIEAALGPARALVDRALSRYRASLDDTA